MAAHSRVRAPGRSAGSESITDLGGVYGSGVPLARSPQLGGATFDSFAIVVWVLPDLTDERELPPGVPVTDWEEFQARFAVHRRGTYGCQAAFGRSWNSAPRLEGCARYSFGVVLVRQDRHLKISIFSDQWTKSFEVDGVGAPARALSDSVRAELLFESDVFSARASLGNELLDLWLHTYQASRSFRKRGIVRWNGSYGDSNRRPDVLAEKCFANLRRILLEARKVHSRRDYARMAEPALLEVQQRGLEILEYLGKDLEQPVASQARNCLNGPFVAAIRNLTTWP